MIRPRCRHATALATLPLGQLSELGWQIRITNFDVVGVIWHILWDVVWDISCTSSLWLLDIGNLKHVWDAVLTEALKASAIIVAMQMCNCKSSLLDFLHCLEVEVMVVLLVDPVVLDNNLTELPHVLHRLLREDFPLS